MNLPNYCFIIDTSALIDLHKGYPEDRFEGLWKTDLPELVTGEKLKAPNEVFKEIQDEGLIEWAKQHKTMFKKLDEFQISKSLEIVSLFPKLIDANKEIPDADPFVIALALERECQQKLKDNVTNTVVSHENPNQLNKIPKVCLHYNVDCIQIVEMFRRLDWKFVKVNGK